MYLKTSMVIACLVLLFLGLAPLSLAEEGMKTEDEAILTLIVETPEEGFMLAIALARKGVTETQPDKEVLHKLRPAYAHDPDSLIAASQVVAIHFQTVAEANNYWRGKE